MMYKYSVLVLTIFAINSQALHIQRNIPVEVRYERFKHDVALNLNESDTNKLNLNEDNAIINNKLNLNKNLEAKVQLSPEELSQAYKHIAVQEVNQKEKLNNVDTTQKSSPVDVTQQIQNIIEQDLRSLSKNFPSESSAKLLSEFEENTNRLLEETRNKIYSRQNPANQQNFFQTFQNAWQNLTNNLITSLNGSTQTSQNGTSNDESNNSQGIVAGLVGGIQDIFTSVTTFINRTESQPSSGNGTIEADSETQQGTNGIVGNIINTIQQAGSNVQNFLSGNRTQNQVSGVNSTVLGDSASQSPINNGLLNDVASGIGNFAQQVQTGVQNIFNTNRTQPIDSNGTVFGDSGTQGSSGNAIIDNLTNLGSNIQQGLQQGVQQVQQAFGGSQSKPSGSEDENSESVSQAPNIPIIGGLIEQISNIFSPQSSTQKPAVEETGTNNNKVSEDSPTESTTLP